MDIKTVTINLKNLMNKWFYTREQIHELLEDYVTVNNQGILSVGIPSPEKITLTTTNNAITTADVAEVTAKITDNSNNPSFGVPVEFVNRATREILHSGATDENGECDFEYFTEDAEILPIQARISNDYLFKDDGRLNSHTNWPVNISDSILERRNTYTRMYGEDPTIIPTIYSPVLSGYTDIQFKIKIVDGTSNTPGQAKFCKFSECDSSGTNINNGAKKNFTLGDFNLNSRGVWYTLQISVLDDRFVLHCKETGESQKIWFSGSLPSYYHFGFTCDGSNFITLDFCDVKINRTSDDLSMFIKDKENLLHFNVWSGGDYNKSTNGFVGNSNTFAVTNNWSSNNDYSIKIEGDSTNSWISVIIDKEDINSEPGTYRLTLDTYKPSNYARVYFNIRNNQTNVKNTEVMIHPNSNVQHITLDNTILESELTEGFDILIFFMNYDPYSPWYVDNLKFVKV